MTRQLSASTTLDNLKKEAKRWLKALRANDPAARTRLLSSYPNAPAQPVLRDVQHALALEYAFNNWKDLRDALAQVHPGPRDPDAVANYNHLAQDMVIAYATADPEAVQRINAHYGQSMTADDLRAMVWRLMYKVRQAKGAATAFQLAEAEELIARTSGFPSWTALIEAVAGSAAPAIPAYNIKPKENCLALRRDLSADDWDIVLAVMKERRIAGFQASGRITDEALRQIAELEFITQLNLEGSRGLTDDGVLQLARMPQLRHLDLSGTKVTDRGLAVLQHLRDLRSFKLTWQPGVSDAGVANLKPCEQLESVNLMGTATGDGALAALRGKPNLRHFNTGRLVTDVGLSYLQEVPHFKTWRGGEIKYEFMGGINGPTSIVLDGPFSNQGFAKLAALEGLFALNLFWHVSALTADGLAPLRDFANLGWIGCQDQLCDDAAMRHIARMPRLRMLMGQGSVATDAGFAELARSETLEAIWGRDCPNLTGRGFLALAKAPSLRALGVNLANVDDAALSTLPDFPALRELDPMNVPDAGFRHIGKCVRLERLWCMYCRDTTDVATEHIAGLHLNSYYAGLTQITDRSLEVLGRMESLEVIELFETKAISDDGLAHLAKLPRLRRIELSGLPNITWAAMKLFPPAVQVNYDV